LHLDENRVKKSLKILSSQETPLLLKNQQLGASPEGDNSHNLFSYNTAFSSTRQVIEIQDISAELTSSSLKVMVHQELFTRKEKVKKKVGGRTGTRDLISLNRYFFYLE
jgi:hypothetical protein